MSTGWNSTDLVFRQVHPSHCAGANPTSQAFSPTPKDQDQLSVDDAAQVSAEGSWVHFTENLGFKSAGTWAVSVAEVDGAKDLVLMRASILDQVDSAKNNPAHCLIDFTKLTTKGERKRRAQTLAIKASARGCQFQASA